MARKKKVNKPFLTLPNQDSFGVTFGTNRWNTEEILKDLEAKIQIEKNTQDLEVNLEKLRVVLKEIRSWNTPDPNSVQGFWLKVMKTRVHSGAAAQMS